MCIQILNKRVKVKELKLQKYKGVLAFLHGEKSRYLNAFKCKTQFKKLFYKNDTNRLKLVLQLKKFAEYLIPVI